MSGAKAGSGGGVEKMLASIVKAMIKMLAKITDVKLEDGWEGLVEKSVSDWYSGQQGMDQHSISTATALFLKDDCNPENSNKSIMKGLNLRSLAPHEYIDIFHKELKFDNAKEEPTLANPMRAKILEEIRAEIKEDANAKILLDVLVQMRAEKNANNENHNNNADNKSDEFNSKLNEAVTNKKDEETSANANKTTQNPQETKASAINNLHTTIIAQAAERETNENNATATPVSGHPQRTNAPRPR